MTTIFSVYAYLRASTKEQDVKRAKNELVKFAENSNFNISSFFIENENGAKLKRPSYSGY